jgi:hypothetical protein
MRTQLREQMLKLAVDLGISSVVVVWDRGLVSWPVNEVQIEILRWVYERISMCVPVDEVALVIADEPGGGRRDRKQWLAETLQLTDHGTEYVTPDRIVLPIVTTPSDHVPHLQLADLVVGATTAAVAGNRYALGLAPLLHQLAHKNAYGAAGGAGIKLFPNDLLNLHHWAFAEDTYWKVGMNSGWGLPAGNGPTRTTTASCPSPPTHRGPPYRIQEAAVAVCAPLQWRRQPTTPPPSTATWQPPGSAELRHGSTTSS